jgi:hypothetical protein
MQHKLPLWGRFTEWFEIRDLKAAGQFLMELR